MKIYWLFCLLLIVGCVSPTKIRYVQDIDSVQISDGVNKPIQLRPNDIITINLASQRMEALSSFYKISYTAMPESSGVSVNVPEYIIDSNGFIKFPQLGKIELSGLTLQEAESKLSTELLEYVNDVAVEIRLRNFKITVLGDVLRPGTFPIDDTQITLLQALGLAGDMNITGDRKQVKVIRETDGSKKSVTLDLTSADFINTEYYYLMQDDIIIVEPNRSKIQTSGFYNTATFFVSIASLVSTMVIVLVTSSR